MSQRPVFMQGTVLLHQAPGGSDIYSLCKN